MVSFATSTQLPPSLPTSISPQQLPPSHHPFRHIPLLPLSSITHFHQSTTCYLLHYPFRCLPHCSLPSVQNSYLLLIILSPYPQYYLPRYPFPSFHNSYLLHYPFRYLPHCPLPSVHNSYLFHYHFRHTSYLYTSVPTSIIPQQLPPSHYPICHIPMATYLITHFHQSTIPTSFIDPLSPLSPHSHCYLLHCYIPSPYCTSLLDFPTVLLSFHNSYVPHYSFRLIPTTTCLIDQFHQSTTAASFITLSLPASFAHFHQSSTPCCYPCHLIPITSSLLPPCMRRRWGLGSVMWFYCSVWQLIWFG